MQKYHKRDKAKPSFTSFRRHQGDMAGFDVKKLGRFGDDYAEMDKDDCACAR